MHPSLRSILGRPTGTIVRRRTGGLLAASALSMLAAGLVPGVAAAATPKLTVARPSVVELGAGQSSKMVWRFVLSAASSSVVSVNLMPQPGYGLKYPDEVQFPSPFKTITFQPGQTVKTWTLTTTGDHEVEGDEQVKMYFSQYVGATGPSIVKGTIVDDDCLGSDPGVASAIVLTPVQGDFGSDITKKAAKIACDGETDWYQVDLTESMTGLGDSTPLTGRVRLVVGDSPAQGGGDLDLCVYRQVITTADTLVACSSAAGVADETVELRNNDSSLSDDSATVWIRVRQHDGVKGPNRYTLKVLGHVVVNVSDNL